MTEKELKKLNRYQLLELLLIQTERADDLQQRLDALVQMVRLKKIQNGELGSIAAESLQVSGIFEAAQKAADLYLDAARVQASEIVQEAHRKAAEIVAQAEENATIATIHHDFRNL
ncbi:MAG: DNA repair protein [Clostridia bacterium]|nr:DNA repair protein [Clostridia bacterium]